MDVLIPNSDLFMVKQLLQDNLKYLRIIQEQPNEALNEILCLRANLMTILDRIHQLEGGHGEDSDRQREVQRMRE